MAQLLARHGGGTSRTDDDGVDAAAAARAAGHADLADELGRWAAADPAPADQDGDDDRHELPPEQPPGRVIREPRWRLRGDR